MYMGIRIAGSESRSHIGSPVRFAFGRHNWILSATQVVRPLLIFHVIMGENTPKRDNFRTE